MKQWHYGVDFITTPPNNSMDVRAKQRLCLLACPLSFSLRGGGFAPRHLSRWAAFVDLMNVEDKTHIVNTWIEHQHKARALGKIPEETFWACEKLYDIVHQQPELAWELILEILTTDQSNVIYENLAAGALEDLLVYHGDEYIDKVEEQAKQNPNFNELLGGVWKNAISEKIWSRVEKARKNVW